MSTRDIHDMGKGRWKSILTGLGVPAQYLTGKNCGCPMCGGKDRFRWTNLHQRGGYFCNGCGAGSAMDLIMKINSWDFRFARGKVLEIIGAAEVEIPKAGDPSTLFSGLSSVWDNAAGLTGMDPVSKYLVNRGIKMREPPKCIRWHKALSFAHADGKRTRHHAMVAKIVAPDMKTWSLHYTYLDDCGRKADLPTVRKNAAGPIPKGGAVRLMASAETMGIAEGIETALSAHLLYDVPVWSALSAGGLTAFEPPATCKSLLIFGDADGSYTGQASAYALAHKLAAKGLHVDVRLPPEVGCDFNDVLASGVAA
jgi:putative DNA primase/helicase